MKVAESTHTTRGILLEVDPPRRIVFTKAWEEGDCAGIETLVELDIRPSGEGTELTLTQQRFNSEEMRDQHNGVWTSCLDCLEECLPHNALGSRIQATMSSMTCSLIL